MDNDEYIYEIAIRDAAIASKNESDWIKAICQMINNEYIRDVAIASNKETVYLEAINQMINDEYIRDVAIASNKETVCHSAIKQMVNDEYLYEVKQKFNNLKVERERKAREEREEREKKVREEREKVERERKTREEREEREKNEKERKAREAEKKEAERKENKYTDRSITQNTRTNYGMDCQNCTLKMHPYCIDRGGTYGYHGENCPRRSKNIIRTAVGNFYACPMCMHMFGPGTPYGIPGWYSGRGY